MRNFRTYTLAVQFHKMVSTLGLSGDAKDQLSRASRSVALNLAEGEGRSTTKDRVRFFTIAMGSLRECQAVLDLEELSTTEAAIIADKLGGSLYCLIKNAR